MKYVTIRDRAHCLDPEYANCSFSKATATKCTNTIVVIGENNFECLSCSCNHTSLYNRLCSFVITYGFTFERSEYAGRDIIRILNPTAQCVVELNNIFNDYHHY